MNARVERITEALLAYRRGEAVDADAADLSVAEAALVQTQVLARLAETVGGWKVALVDGAAVAAPLHASTILASGYAFQRLDAPPFKIETELGFRLGRDLPYSERGYRRDEIVAAIVSLHAAFEIVRPRVAEPPAVSFPLFLADALGNAFTVLAEGRPCAMLPAHGTLSRDGQVVTAGAHPHGDPLAPLLALANRRGNEVPGGLRAGQIIITGSFTGALPVDDAGSFRGAFDGLPPVTARFVASAE